MKNLSRRTSIALSLILFLAFASWFLVFSQYSKKVEVFDLDKIRQKIVRIEYDVQGYNQQGKKVTGTLNGSGVIFFANKNLIQIGTNRHVIDCGYGLGAQCFKRSSEKVRVVMHDGKVFDVSQILIAPHGLDIAILNITTNKSKEYYQAYSRNIYDPTLSINERVVAVGYPNLTDSSSVKFSTSEGRILGFEDLVISDKISFKIIYSDAYTSFGSSGGGLFDSNGRLIGLTTWITDKSRQSKAIEANIVTINLNDPFIVCPSGYHFRGNSTCIPYVD